MLLTMICSVLRSTLASVETGLETRKNNAVRVAGVPSVGLELVGIKMR
jgi:hypothetical protein